MKAPPQDIAWIRQAQVLELCEISRATLNSWINGGLDIPKGTAAYKVGDLVKLLLFEAARPYLTPQQMGSAWTDLVRKGEDNAIIAAARKLKPGQRFDLVVDTKYHSLRVVHSDKDLVAAVRRPSAPRPVVVIDLTERVVDSVEAFYRGAREEPPPATRKPGRPKRAKGGLRLIDQEDAG